ncbi:MAG: hypothetical protein ACD_41C00072G0002 [uncultured bacterium]|nr:MAG: hypothetical protein ACD_41C00072G0002 [uncultured bacterium]
MPRTLFHDITFSTASVGDYLTAVEGVHRDPRRSYSHHHRCSGDDEENDIIRRIDRQREEEDDE